MPKLLPLPCQRFHTLTRIMIPAHPFKPSLHATLRVFSPPGHLRGILLTHSPSFPHRRVRFLSTRAFEDSPSSTEKAVDLKEVANGAPASGEGDGGVGTEKAPAEDYPSEEFEMEEFSMGRKLLVKLRMLLALPWERVKKGSILSMKLKGQISDQLKSRFSSGLSLPQICENFIKAAYDPRISGIYLQIEPLSCGWGKLEEIRRHILNFKKSGKPLICYIPICGEKEYYLACACEELYVPPSAYVALFGLTVQASFLGGVLEKVGVEPQIQRIGKYKNAGDSISRKSMSAEVCDMLTTLLDNIYGNWLDTVSSSLGKTREDVEKFIESGVFQVERLKEDGWVTNILYDDEIISSLKDKLGLEKEKKLPMVDYGKYAKVRRWTLGLGRGVDQIAVIRASGSIRRTASPLGASSSGITAEEIIEKIRSARESKKYKAVIIRIDSPGGDALASDLMWREIKLLAASKPVIASMSDVAASGGYYMAMAAGDIVAEKLTVTGSIGVVTGKFSLKNLYEKVGFNKEILSRGKYAELNSAEQRPFRPDEEELFAKSAQNAYKQFRDKAALSRSMNINQMEDVAQGRVWSGTDAASRGLVDAIGGFSRAVAIAKKRANIAEGRQVALVELSRPQASLPALLSSIGSTVIGLDRTVNEVLHDITSSQGVQARMDGVLFERVGSSALDNDDIVLLLRNIINIF